MIPRYPTNPLSMERKMKSEFRKSYKNYCHSTNVDSNEKNNNKQKSYLMMMKEKIFPVIPLYP